MDLRSKIRVIEGFPKEGISFKDVTTLIADREAFREAIRLMTNDLKGIEIDCIAAPEARGFIFGAALAGQLGVGFIPFRKKGKLPAETWTCEYALEYGENVLQVHKDAIRKGMKVAIVDDLLATGGTAIAMKKLLETYGAEVVALEFLIELTSLEARRNFLSSPIHSIVQYEI